MKGKRGQPAREANLAQKYKAQGQGTTVMIRNIPVEYTQDELIYEVSQSMGSTNVNPSWIEEGLFDFFYLPWDSTNNCNVGYAFVNFHNSGIAQKAVRVFSNYKFRTHESSKVGQVSPAHIQGLENNLRHLQDRAVVHGSLPYSPVVMWKHQKIELSAIFQELKTQDTLNKFRESAVSPDLLSPPQSQPKQQVPALSSAPADVQRGRAPGRSSSSMAGLAPGLRGLDDSAQGGMEGLGGSIAANPTGLNGGVDDLFEEEGVPLDSAESSQQAPLSAPGVQKVMTLSQRFGINGPMKPMSSRGVRRGPFSMTSLPVVIDSGESHGSNSEAEHEGSTISAQTSSGLAGLVPLLPGPVAEAGGKRTNPLSSSSMEVLSQPPQRPITSASLFEVAPTGQAHQGQRLVACAVKDGVPTYTPNALSSGSVMDIPVPPVERPAQAKTISLPNLSMEEDLMEKFLKRFGD